MMELQTARETYPMVFNDIKHPDCSDHYTFVNTGDVVKGFMDMGMTIHDIKAPKSKKDPRFLKHMVRMNLPNTEIKKVGDEIPQILIVNSHKRDAGFQLHLGIFRMVCANGLIVSDTDFAKFYQRHMNLDINNLYEAMKRAITEFHGVYEKIDAYKNTLLNARQRRDFAGEALEMIYNENAGKYEINDFLTPSRIEDNTLSLYEQYNIVQERVMKGNASYETKKGHKKSKAIKSVDKDLNNNLILWSLMARYYQNISKQV